MKLSNILNSIHKGVCFLGGDFETIEPLTGGKKNEQQGRITKRMTGAIVMLNSNYENARNKQLQVAGLKPTFTVQPRRWGLNDSQHRAIVTHKGKVYLSTSILKAGKVSYFLDGQPIDKADIIGLKESKGVGIDENEVRKQLSELSDKEKEALAVNAYMIDEAINNPDSIELDGAILDELKASTKMIYPRDYKAESITALRVKGNEYQNINPVEV